MRLDDNVYDSGFSGSSSRARRVKGSASACRPVCEKRCARINLRFGVLCLPYDLLLSKAAMRVSSPRSHGGCLLGLTLDGVLLGDVFGRAREVHAYTGRSRSTYLASFSGIRVGRIEPHDDQRDVVAGVTLIGSSEQRLQRLWCGLGVESSRDCIVRHHFC